MISTIHTSKGEVTIRIANIQDAPQVYDLRLEALRMHADAFTADVSTTVERGVQAWVKLIADYSKDQTGALMIATCEDEIIGMAGLVRGHWPKTRHRADMWGVFVKPAWRGIHLCEGIVKNCLDWASAHQITAIMLGVNSTNASAIHCYSRCGFYIYGIEPRAIYDQSVYYEEYLMIRLL
jgi:RimJ/RimL family protein N-acetyltransferase